MSLENKIAALLEQAHNAQLDEALGPGAGVKEGEPAMQGSSQRASYGAMNAGGAKSPGSANRLAPGAGAKEAAPSPQGSSQVPGWEDIAGDDVGTKASALASETNAKPLGQGPGGPKGQFTPSVDPTSTVNKSGSKGNNGTLATGITESVSKLFADEKTLSEEFKEKATNLFSALVEAKIAELREELENEVAQHATQQILDAEQLLTENVDKYLTYIAEQWIEANEAQVVNSVKVEMAESFFAGLRELYEQHHITLPDEGLDVVTNLQSQIEDLKTQLDAKVAEAVTQTESVQSLKRKEIIAEQAKGLALTEIEKLGKLCESVEFINDAKFAEKVQVIKENYFPNAKKSVATDDEGTGTASPESGPVDPDVAAVLRVIGRTKF